MRIHTLEISFIRGIHYFRHDFEGKNAVILGANGTGKSSILDAIDFLLTGKIARLEGVGTSGLTLKRHGIHVDMSEDLTKGYVSASVSLPEHTDAVVITRYVSEPEHLICCESVRPILEKVQGHALQGQHLLQRQQMLRFVNVTPNDRASRVQSLLNLNAIEKARSGLTSATNDLRRKHKQATGNWNQSKSKVATHLSIDTFEPEYVLEAVNRLRTVLGLQHASALSPDEIKNGISRIPASETGKVSFVLALEKLTVIEEFISPSGLGQFGQEEKGLRARLEAVRSDPQLLRSFDQFELIRDGIELAEADSCPLCDVPWNREELHAHLQSKIQKAGHAKSLVDDIESSAKSMNVIINNILTRLPTDDALLGFLTDSQTELLGDWRMKLEKLEATLRDSRRLYPDASFVLSDVQCLFVSESLINGLTDIQKSLKQLENVDDTEVSDLEIARQKLTLVADAWLEMEQHEENCKGAEMAFERAAKIQDTFREARDEVLSDIYKSVSIEFSQLYRQLHGPDEDNFGAQLYPRDAGVYLDVEFHDRGRFPPNALHSEGHQDSMGLCFFFVLAAGLSGNDLQFILLDDVVSSMDEGHRRELATLLTSRIVDRQVIVTTHDPTWSEMLSRVQFADPSNSIRIDRWDIDVGMIHSDITPIWDLIDDFLANTRVVAAASEVRRYAETLLKEVCDSLGAPVPYKIHGRVTLSDVLGPGTSRFKKILSRATRIAQKNGNTQLLGQLDLLENTRSRVYDEFDSDGWLLNKAVHSNRGSMPTPDEIRRAVTAFREFHNLVHCECCHQMLKLSEREKVVSCKCGNVLWKV